MKAQRCPAAVALTFESSECWFCNGGLYVIHALPLVPRYDMSLADGMGQLARIPGAAAPVSRRCGQYDRCHSCSKRGRTRLAESGYSTVRPPWLRAILSCGGRAQPERTHTPRDGSSLPLGSTTEANTSYARSATINCNKTNFSSWTHMSRAPPSCFTSVFVSACGGPRRLTASLATQAYVRPSLLGRGNRLLPAVPNGHNQQNANAAGSREQRAPRTCC